MLISINDVLQGNRILPLSPTNIIVGTHYIGKIALVTIRKLILIDGLAAVDGQAHSLSKSYSMFMLILLVSFCVDMCSYFFVLFFASSH